MNQHVPRGLYEEALETYENLRPVTETARYVIYDLTEDDWRHLLRMARYHLDGQIAGASNEDGHVTRCKRYLKQLRALSGVVEKQEQGE